MSQLRKIFPSMNGLFTFEAAARYGNFSRAAGELNVTPAAVSRMVSRLEGHLGAALFLRHPGGVKLTDDGQLLFDAITHGFSGIESAVREIQDRKSGAETVSLSVSTAFTTHWMMPRMARFKRDFPNVDLRFQLIMGPLSGSVTDVDLGMRFVNGPDDRHEATYVMPELLVPICSPAYRETHRDGGPQELPQTMINLSEAEPDWLSLLTTELDWNATSALIFSDYSVVVQAALMGQGIALGWLNVVAHWMRTEALVPVGRPVARPEQRHCHLVRLRDKPLRPIVTMVRDWIVSELNDDVRTVAALYPELALNECLKGTARPVQSS